MRLEIDVPDTPIVRRILTERVEAGDIRRFVIHHGEEMYRVCKKVDEFADWHQIEDTYAAAMDRAISEVHTEWNHREAGRLAQAAAADQRVGAGLGVTA